MNLNQFRDNGKTGRQSRRCRFVTTTPGYNSWMPSIDCRYRLRNNWSVYASSQKAR